METVDNHFLPPNRYPINTTEIVKVINDPTYDHNLHFNTVLAVLDQTTSPPFSVEDQFFADAEFYAVVVVSSVSTIVFNKRVPPCLAADIRYSIIMALIVTLSLSM